MNIEGKLLERAVKIHDLTVEQIAMKTGISKTQLYRLFKKDLIGEKEKRYLLKVKINVNELVRLNQLQENNRLNDLEIFPNKETINKVVSELLLVNREISVLNKQYEILSREVKDLEVKIETKADKKTKLE